MAISWHTQIPVISLISTDQPNDIRRVDSVEERYAPTLADTIPDLRDRVKVDLSGIRPEGRLIVLRRLMKGGLIHGKTKYYLSSAASSTKDSVVYMYAQEGIMLDYFNQPKDVIRGGAIETPLMEGFIEQFPMTIMVVPDGTWGTGDGQSVLNAETANRLSLEHWLPKFGSMLSPGIFRLVDDSAKLIVKGGLVIQTIQPIRQGLRAPDMIVPEGAIKGHLENWINPSQGVRFVMGEFTWGINQFYSKVAVEIGYQMTRDWPKQIWDQIEEMWPLIAADLNNRAADPLTLVSAKGQQALRSDTGRIQEGGILHRAVQFALKSGNSDLLYSSRLNQIVNNILAADNLAAVVSGGLKGIGLYAVHNSGIADGIVMVNPKDMPDGEDVLGRYPHPRFEDCVAVRTVAASWVTPGTCVLNSRTGKPLKHDFDGDMLVLVRASQAKHARTWWEILRKLKRLDSNKRSDRAPAPSIAEAIDRIMAVNIGTVDNAMSELNALAQANGLWSFHGRHVDGVTKAIIDAVDVAKGGVLPDMEYIKNLRKSMRELGVTPQLMLFRQLANGTLPPWKVLKRSVVVGDMLFEKGEYITPWKAGVSGETYIGRSMLQLGKLLPERLFQAKDNGQFVNWLPDGEGEGAEAATTAYNQVQAELRKAGDTFKRATTQAQDQFELGIIEEEELNNLLLRATEAYDEVRGTILKAWDQTHYKMLVAEDRDKSFLENYARRMWRMSFTGNGSQYFLWYSIPEIIFDCLDANIANIRFVKNRAPITGYIVGRPFAQYFGDDEEKIVVTGRFSVKPSKAGKSSVQENIIVREDRTVILEDGSEWKIAETSGSTSRHGQVQLTVSRTASQGRFAFFVAGETKGERNAAKEA